MKRICVFAGSDPGRRSEYEVNARALGTILASRNIGFVYGGGGTGLMGVLADAVLAGDAPVTGIIPAPLADRGLAHPGLTDLRIVASMHERKAMMADLADAFITLPGGLGTLEEFLEIWTWAKVGIHTKPCGILNTIGYYDPLMEFIGRMIREEFAKPVHRGVVIVEPDAKRLLDRLAEYQPPPLRKWVEENGG